MIPYTINVTYPDTKLEFTSELETDWQDWLLELFPDYCKYDFSSYPGYHVDFWDWAWSIEKGKQAKSFISIWPRRGAKSTSTELACVALAATGKRKYALYISGTQDQADDHVANIQSLLESDAVQEYYPELGKPQLNKLGNLRGWKQSRLRTANGFIVDAIGLDAAARGVKLDAQRPDLIIVDDIDKESDSRSVTAKKIKTLTRALLPAGSDDVAILAVQNLVHKDSVFSQLIDGRAGFLSDRVPSKPIPALHGLTYERRNDGLGYVVTGGQPTWEGLRTDHCQDLIDDIGLDAFLAECQHEVAQTAEGALFSEFSEVMHLITWSEFANAYGKLSKNDNVARDPEGNPCLPALGNIGCSQDWGTTRGHPCVTGWMWRPFEYAPLNDCYFLYRDQCFPNWPVPEKPLLPVSPGRVMRAIHKAEEPWAERERVIVRRMSHEQSAAANTYLQDLPEEEREHWQKWKPDSKDGIPQIQNYLAIDYTKKHPFRVYPVGHKQEGEPIMGRPRLYFIVADGQGELYMEGDQLKVKPPTDHAGLIRGRAELPTYKNKQTLAGDELDSPDNKLFDDFVDMLKGLARYFMVVLKRATEAQKIERALPERLKLEAAKDLSPEEKEELWMQRQLKRDEIKDQRAKKKKKPSWLQPINFRR